jgi:hypothetical protein
MLFVLLISCGTKLPQELENPYQYPHTDCNPTTHFFSRGIGSSPRAAIDTAHRDVSEQIISQIQSQTHMLTEYEELVTVREGLQTTNSRSKEYLLSEINTYTSFSHNELIRNLIPPMEYEGKYYMLACLNKEEAGKVLRADLQPKMDHFSSVYSKTLKQYDDGNLSGFTTQYNQLRSLSSDIVPDLYIIRSVTGKVSRSEKKYRSQWNDVDDKANDIRSKTTIGITMNADDVDASTVQSIQDAIRKGFEGNGLNVVDSVDGCTDEISHLANITLQNNCNPPGSMGIICKPSLEIIITHCTTNEGITIGIRDKQLSGQDYYKEEKALSNALKKLDKMNVKQILNQEINGFFPLASY